MRKINKGEPLADFVNFAKRNPSANWKDFVETVNDIYQKTRFQILTEEQDCLCGYSEILIESEEDSHIDHYLKRDFDARKTFNWDNLIVSDNNSAFGAKYKDNIYRIKRTEYGQIFNPVEDDIQKHFYYNEFGLIEPVDTLEEHIKSKVYKTVEVFNLKNPSLIERRKQLIRDIRSYQQVGLDNETIKNTLSRQGFKSLIEQYCQ